MPDRHEDDVCPEGARIAAVGRLQAETDTVAPVSR